MIIYNWIVIWYNFIVRLEASKVLYGYVNNGINLPQIDVRTLTNESILKKFALEKYSNISPKIFTRKESLKEQLYHLKADKEFLKKIDEICPMQSIDHVENRLFTATKPGDVVITSTLMNFSRYLEQALKVVRFFYEKRVRVISLLENFDSFRSECLMKDNWYIEFQKNKATEARNNRKDADRGVGGNKACKVEDYPLFAAHYSDWKDNLINKTVFAEKIGVSRPTLDKLIKQFDRINIE